MCTLILLAVLAISASCSAASDVFFAETFSEDVFASGTWQKSVNAKYHLQPLMVKSSATAPEGFLQDLGVQLTQDMKHYAFGSMLSEPASIREGKALVLQYEVKFEEGLKCGGAYVKLLRDAPAKNLIEELNSDSPYSIMFGPDRCGATNKVHFIVQHFNPISEKWEEKHFNEAISVHGDKNTHLYTLIINADNSFEIRIDNKMAKTGDLLKNFSPPINPPRMINDPNDVRPANWDDRAKIPDPTAFKPESWDESQPRKIADVKAVKPAYWADDAPLEIPDPTAVKPRDWDDEQDGEWDAPLVPNPVCESTGCGKWKAPLIDNPRYQGKWIAPLIDNPDYQGIWAPKQIENPLFYEDLHPALSLAPVRALALELWTTNAALHFDNFIVAADLSAVESMTQLFEAKAEAERAGKEALRRAQRAEREQQLLENGTISDKIQVYVGRIADAISDNPQATIGTCIGLVIAFFWLIIKGGQNAVQHQLEADKPDDQAAESTSEKTDDK